MKFAHNYPIARLLVNVAAAVTLVIFIISLISPLFTLEKFYFFSNTVSLFSALMSLLEKGHIVLFIIIFLFSILFPLFKLGVIVFVWNSHAGSRVQQLLKWIHRFGKWSMLDVFVVALLVVSIKFEHLADMQIHYGLYLFLGSVVMSMLIAAISMWYLESHLKMLKDTQDKSP